MTDDIIRYDLLMQEALRGVVRKVLADAAREGLPGEHHFNITFLTKARGVKLSARTRERFPNEMTIILQHQFRDLAVNEASFEVVLSFGGISEKVVVPFDAVTAFYDPSVNKGFKFETLEPAADVGAKDATPFKPALARNDKPPRGAGSEPNETKPKLAPVPRRDDGKDDKKPDGKSADGDAKVVSIDTFRKKP